MQTEAPDSEAPNSEEGATEVSEKQVAQRAKSSYAGKNRNQTSVMLICSNRMTSGQVRQAIKSIGFSKISTVQSHVQAYERLRTRNFELILFDAKGTDMPSKEFVEKAVEMDPNVIMIAISSEPSVDDVFGLLKAGARAFLAIPFTVESTEEVLVRAQEGPPLSEAVLNAPDRNSALVGVILNNLYRVSVLMRQAREFDTAGRELERQHCTFVESIDLARLFCEGGDDALMDKIQEACIARANAAATRLGRTRQKLKKNRMKALDGLPTLSGMSQAGEGGS